MTSSVNRSIQRACVPRPNSGTSPEQRADARALQAASRLPAEENRPVTLVRPSPPQQPGQGQPASAMDRLERKLVAGCPAPLSDPRYPKWEDFGGKKLQKGVNKRWVELVQWMPGEAGGAGGFFAQGHYTFKSSTPARAIVTFAKKFGELPVDAIGVQYPPEPGDVLIRSLADLAAHAQANIEQLEYRADGEPDLEAFTRALREGYYPINVPGLKRVVTAITGTLTKQLVKLLKRDEYRGAELGAAVRLCATEPEKHLDPEQDDQTPPEQCTAERFLAGFLGTTDEPEEFWTDEQEQQLQWVQEVAEQATKTLGMLVRNKERRIKANSNALEGSAKERLNHAKRGTAARPRTEPAWPAGWGDREEELRAQLGLTKDSKFDRTTEQEIAAQMEELTTARSDCLWGCARNIAAASGTTTHTPRAGEQSDSLEEERLDTALKDMFEADSTRMLLLYRLPPDAVVKFTRPDWGRIVRNVPEYHNMAAARKKKKKGGIGTQIGDKDRPATQPQATGRFNADIDNYQDGPVSQPGRQAAVLKDRDVEWNSTQVGLKGLKDEIKESEEEWKAVQSRPRPQSSLDHLPAMSRRQIRAERRKEMREDLRSKSEASLLPAGA